MPKIFVNSVGYDEVSRAAKLASEESVVKNGGNHGGAIRDE
jgi:hypothetical protein